MSQMPKLPSMPKLKSISKCACGCPGTTQSRFVPGHDSKLKGMRMRVEAGVWNKDARLEDGSVDLIAQLDAIAETFGPTYAAATAKEMRLDWTIEGWAERAA